MSNVDFNTKQFDVILDLVNKLENENDINIKSDLNEQIAYELNLLYDNNNLNTSYVQEHIAAILDSNFRLVDRVANSKDYPNLLCNDVIFQFESETYYIHARFIAKQVELTILSLPTYHLSEIDSNLLDGIKHITNNPIVTRAIVESISF